jgi:periplasmic copper chaperone A
MKCAVPILALLLWLPSACHQSDDRAAPSAASIRLPTVPGRPGVGYFDLDVEPEQAALRSVTSPQIGRIEMHETMFSGAMSGMRPLDRAAIDAGERLVFAPGGRHLMLFDVNPALRPGSRAILTFHFERGPDRILAASVRSPGEPEPAR